jgi:hypothetical protein
MTHDRRNPNTDRRVNPGRRRMNIAQAHEDRRIAVFVRRVLVSRRAGAAHYENAKSCPANKNMRLAAEVTTLLGRGARSSRNAGKS